MGKYTFHCLGNWNILAESDLVFRPGKLSGLHGEKEVISDLVMEAPWYYHDFEGVWPGLIIKGVLEGSTSGL